MSFYSECNKRYCFEWIVQRPLGNKTPRKSLKFIHNGKRFYLIFESLFKGAVYTLVMVSAHSSLSADGVSVHVVDNEGRALKLSNKEKTLHFLRRKDDPLIWAYHTFEIVKEVPNFLTNGIIKFVIIFNVEVKLKRDPSTAVANRSAVQVVEKSVQTSPYNNDAACLDSLSEDLSNLLELDHEPDVILTCGDRKVRTHRKILCARSSVFAAMLNNGMAQNGTAILDIKGMDQGALNQFVRYLYSGKLPDLTVDIAKDLYEAADKYSVKSLFRRCAYFLEEHMDSDNSCEMLTLANAHSDSFFKETAMNYILQNKLHLKQDDRWLTFCKNQPVLANEVFNSFCRTLSDRKETNRLEVCDETDQPKRLKLSSE